MQPIFLLEVSVRGNLKLQNQFLFAYCYIHGASIPQEVTQDSFQRTQRMRITRSVIHSCKTILKFLDVNKVNVFVIYLCIVIDMFLPSLK